MTTNGKLELVVRSRKVLSRVDSYDVSVRGLDGLQHVSRRSLNVFDYVLDEQQSRALEEARDLAARSGLTLEVVDLTRQGAFLRLMNLGSAVFGLDIERTANSLRGLALAKGEPGRAPA